VTNSEKLSAVAVEQRAIAFSRLVDRNLNDSYRLAAIILGDRDDAEDATHDAAVRAWQKWPSLRDPARFEPWFQRILVNVCRDRLRRRRPTSDLRDVASQTTGDSTQPSDDRDRLQHALAQLSAEHRMVIALRYLSDLRVEDIAERTGTSAGTVKSRLHYALANLRTAYQSDERIPKDAHS